MNAILSGTEPVRAFASSLSQNIFSQLTPEQKRIAAICAIAITIFIAIVALVGACSSQSFGGGNGGIPYAPPTVVAKPWEDSLEFKQELMLKAWNHFQAVIMPEKEKEYLNGAKWKDTAAKVDAYFQDALQRLGSGENVPVPMFYHASRAAADLIAGSSTLKKSSWGVQGPGVYFSTRDEHYGGYGDFTFAMDPVQVEADILPVTYSSGGSHGGTEEESALWMCSTNNDIVLQPNRVAYVIIPDDDETVQADKINKFWQEGSFFVPLMTRLAADEIRKSLTAVHIHKMAAHWKPYYGPRNTGLQHIVV